MYANGRAGKRIRKKFDTRIEAARFKNFALASISQEKDWNPSKSDNRKIIELIEVCFKLCGVHLKDGVRRKSKLERLAIALGDPAARKLESKNVSQQYLVLILSANLCLKDGNLPPKYTDSPYKIKPDADLRTLTNVRLWLRGYKNQKYFFEIKCNYAST